jgi:hypothetical protein
MFDDDSQIFSQASEIDGQVYRCEAGCIHVNVHNVNLRFENDEFLLFAYMISEALEKVAGVDIDEIYRMLNARSKPRPPKDLPEKP